MPLAQPSEPATLASLCVILPVRDPEPLLLNLIRDLYTQGFTHILLVNDGSTPSSNELFAACSAAGAELLTHPANLGKGRALKTAFAHILAHHPDTAGVITADADGQHAVLDIARTAHALLAHNTVILGTRALTTSAPLRSRIGNTLTRALFSFATRSHLQDTQTGLRGLPQHLLPQLLALPGERYEYEMNILAFLIRSSLPVYQLPIQTIYSAGNRSSHFRPLRDSILVTVILIRLLAQRLSSFLQKR